MKKHGERAHSKFSASASERWFKCPGSVELSEGVEDKQHPSAAEGEQAHEVLESLFKCELSGNDGADTIEAKEVLKKATRKYGGNAAVDMINHASNLIRFIVNLAKGAEILIETRVYLAFIHLKMFGTFDSAIIDDFGTLHVFDYKYGTKYVSPERNLQMIFYAIGLAFLYNWNFKRVRLWIAQPRVRGYDGPMFWEISIEELKKYVDVFKRAVEKVEKFPKLYVEGEWCFWCKAKKKCPLKQGARLSRAEDAFRANPVGQQFKKGVQYGEIFKEETVTIEKTEVVQVSEAQWKKLKAFEEKEARRKKKESGDFF